MPMEGLEVERTCSETETYCEVGKHRGIVNPRHIKNIICGRLPLIGCPWVLLIFMDFLFIMELMDKIFFTKEEIRKGNIDQELCSPEEWDIYCRLRNCWMYDLFQMTEYVELPLEIQYAIMRFEEKYSDLTAKGESEKFYNEFHTHFGKDLYGSIIETFSKPQ